MTDIRIDFNKPTMIGKEMEYVAQSFLNAHISGDGYFTKQCQALIETSLNAKKAILTTSCTHALEMAALLLDIKPGDEVICPSFTFVSTINAFVLRGAIPRFIDIRSDTLNLDENLLERMITPKTRAILAVHYAGVGCEMGKIMAIAEKYKIPVIEDNAHGLFGKFEGRFLGTFGCMATQSFHETKNFSCGEGGAIILNDPALVERAEIIREKGTDRSRFFRGMVDKYTWVDIGSSYLPSDILAAILFAQLEAREKIQEKRKEIWQTYFSRLGSWAEEQGVHLPFVPYSCEQAYHMFYLILPSLQHRQQLMATLRQDGIYSVFHYLPLNSSKMGMQFGAKPGDCPVTERISDCLLRLPFYYSLSEEDQNSVIDNILKFKIN